MKFEDSAVGEAVRRRAMAAPRAHRAVLHRPPQVHVLKGAAILYPSCDL